MLEDPDHPWAKGRTMPDAIKKTSGLLHPIASGMHRQWFNPAPSRIINAATKERPPPPFTRAFILERCGHEIHPALTGLHRRLTRAATSAVANFRCIFEQIKSDATKHPLLFTLVLAIGLCYSMVTGHWHCFGMLMTQGRSMVGMLAAQASVRIAVLIEAVLFCFHWFNNKRFF